MKDRKSKECCGKLLIAILLQLLDDSQAFRVIIW